MATRQRPTQRRRAPRRRTAVAAPKTPVSRKGERTRARIVSSAIRVFIRDGYLDARVADIAKGAGVSHGSFYTYFDSKAEVFRDVASAVVDEMYEALEVRGLGTTPIERLHEANRRYFELYEKHAGILALIEQVATFDDHFRKMRLELRQRFVDRIEGAVRRIYERDESDAERLDPRIAANALGGMVDDFSYTWFVLKEPFDRQEALRTLDAIWVRALGLPSE